MDDIRISGTDSPANFIGVYFSLFFLSYKLMIG